MKAIRIASRRSARLFGAGLLVGALTLPLAACGSSTDTAETPTPKPVTTTTTPTTTPAATPSATPTTTPAGDTGDAVAGYQLGEIPPLPLFELPSLALLDDTIGGFSVKVADAIPDVPGLKIAPAACGDAVVRAKQGSSMVLNGDGSGTMADQNGSIVNNGDGSGTFSINGVDAIVNGDGSGTFDDGTTSIINNGDGSGSYTTPTVSVVVNGDGSGTRTDSALDTSLINNGDGSGSYTANGISIINNGDGSGSYTADDLSIINNGDGTALVNGTDVKVGPLPKALPVGSFPAMGSIAPIEYCGTTITLEDSVLFDFDKSDLRPEAKETLDALAKVLIDLNVPAAEIGGHTDSIGTDEYNQDLSERRADAVVKALTERGVTSSLAAVGYGESAPVAANEINGQDNPAGRQLNRRVEIFIPAF